jgi:broad specificity phosphatase PhoE
VVVASPLQRAIDTAAQLSPSAQVDDRWVELDYGPLDLQLVGDVPPNELARWRDDADFAPPGVETLASLSARVCDACDDLVAKAEDSVVIVVSHVSPIKAAIGWALGVEPTVASRLFVEDASVSRIDVVGSRPLVRWFNRFGEEPAESAKEPVRDVFPRR